MLQIFMASLILADCSGQFVPRREDQLLGGQRLSEVNEIALVSYIPHLPKHRCLSQFIREWRFVKDRSNEESGIAAQLISIMLDRRVDLRGLSLENVADEAEKFFPVLRPVDMIAHVRLIANTEQNGVAYAGGGREALVFNLQLDRDSWEPVYHVHAGSVGYVYGEPRANLIFGRFPRYIVGFSRVSQRATSGVEPELSLAKGCYDKGDTERAQNNLNASSPSPPFGPAPSALLRVKITAFAFCILFGVFVALYAFKRGCNALLKMQWGRYARCWSAIFAGACLACFGVVQIIDAKP